MNTLPYLPCATYTNALVTLNLNTASPPAFAQATLQYRRPRYNARVIVRRPSSKTHRERTGFGDAGAGMGYGFNDDGCRIGLQVGVRLRVGGCGCEVYAGLKRVRGRINLTVGAVVEMLQVWSTAVEGGVK